MKDARWWTKEPAPARRRATREHRRSVRTALRRLDDRDDQSPILTSRRHRLDRRRA